MKNSVEVYDWYKTRMESSEELEWAVYETLEMMFEDGYKGKIKVSTLYFPPERMSVAI